MACTPSKSDTLPFEGAWSVQAIQELLDKPFMDLMFQAQSVHREHWPAGDIELATLLSVKTGGCPRTAATARRRPSSTPASRQKSS